MRKGHKEEKDRYPTFGSSAEAIVNMGYHILPIKHGSKAPMPTDWTNYQFKAADLNMRHPDGQRYADGGIGILAGEVVGVDIDVRDAEVANEIVAEVEAMLGPAPKRVGAAPKVLLMYRAGGARFSKRQTKQYRF